MIHVVCAILAICCSIAAIILVSAFWAQDASSSDPYYIGPPTWENNQFPSYHPILMVSGFHFSQVLAICMWSLIPVHELAKLFHVLFNLAGIGCMTAALYAITDFEQNVYVPSLTSMHSWMGVMTITWYGLQVIGGFAVGVNKVANPEDVNQIPLVKVHKGTGIVTLGLTTITILAGIQNYLRGPEFLKTYYLGTGYCGYVMTDDGEEKNPAKHFGQIPASCRVAFGMGICVVLASIFTGLAAYFRNVFMVEAQYQQAQQEQAASKTQSVPGGGENYEVVNR